MSRRLDVLLTSLRAEGTPRLTLEMCRAWEAAGLVVGLTVLFPDPDDLRGEFEALGVPIRSLDLPRMLIARWGALAWSMYRLRRANPGVAIVSMAFGWHAFAFMGARLAGRGAHLVHIGNFPTPDKAARWFVFRALVLFGRPLTTAYVCCSAHVGRGAQAMFHLPAKALHVIPNGVVVPPFNTARNGHGPELRLGMVATLEAHKDHATLLRAMPALAARLGRDGRSPKLLLAGEGSLRLQLERLAEDLAVTHLVEFLGIVKDIPALLATLDVFVFSTTEAEGQGIALLEAMAAGVPIVASNVGACREVLDGGTAGLLFAPGDPLVLADAVLSVLDGVAAAQARRIAAHSKVSRVYGVGATAADYARLCFDRER